MTPRVRQGRGRALCCLLYVGALLLPGLLTAQPETELSGEDLPEPSPRRSAGRAVSRITADRFVDRVIDGEPITYLYGNVYIDRDTLTARSDTALHYRRRQMYEFISNVRMRQHGTLLTCRRAIYRRNEGAADFFGDVRVEEEDAIGSADRGESRQAGDWLYLIGNARFISPEYTVWADTIVRERLSEQGNAYGQVKIIDPASQTLVTGEHAFFAGDGSYARVDVDPVMTSRGHGRETFAGEAEVMHFYRADQRIVMVDSVFIDQGRTKATADTAFVYGQERLLLRGRPRVRVGKQSVMTGREIEFLYRDEQLYRIILRGRAVMEDSTPDSLASRYAGLPPLDILDGDTITIDFKDEKLQRSTVLGNAHSQYVPTDVVDEVAYNDVRGDTIIIHFRDEKVNRVNVKGNMTGTYTFARISEMLGRSEPDSADSLSVLVEDSLALVASDSLAFAPDDSVAAAAVDGLRIAVDDSLALARDDSLVIVASDTQSRVSPDSLDSIPDLADGQLDFRGHAERVEYSGGEVMFHMRERNIEIKRNAELIYGNLNLTANEVDFDTRDRELYAAGDPLLVDEGQTITGDRMGYNFDYRSGAVLHGTTDFEGNYYSGKEIKRFDDGSMKILSGRMTACDLAEPHYHFWADKMKIKLGDKFVAKPIVLKIGHVPVFALPFYFKSLKSGRRSGILFPSFNFGWSSRSGRYIRDFGYYWATNDYTDFRVEGDYNENREFTYQLRNRYVKRYGFDGGVSYTRKISLGEQRGAREWQLQWNHRQDALFDEYNVTANVEMASQTLSTNNLSDDIGRDVVSGQLHSTASISRRWSFMNANLNLVRDEYTNAADDDSTTDERLWTQTLPKLNLSFNRRSILPSLRPGQDGSFIGDLLRDTYYSLGTSFTAGKTQRELTAIQTYSGAENVKVDIRPPRVAIFDVSTGISASHSWSSADTTGIRYETVGDSLTGGVIEVDGRRWSPNSSLSFNSNLRTTLYGIFPLGLGSLQALRHTVTFSAGHAWRPAIAEMQQRSQSLSFSMGNRFDLKYLQGSASDSTWQEAKLDGLLDWNLSTSYRPDADVDSRWSDVGSTISIKPGRNRNLNFKVSNSIDPYEWRILTTRFTYGLNLQGRFDTGAAEELLEAPRNQALEKLGLSPDSLAANRDGPIPEDEQEEDPFADEEFAGYGQRPQGGATKDVIPPKAVATFPGT
ncbi:MAG: putative LPS assembly protein LptD [bacterium]